MVQAYIHRPNSTNLMMQGIKTRQGYDALEQQAMLHRGGSSRVSGRAFAKEKQKKTREEERSAKEADKIGKERAKAGTEKIKAETRMIKAGIDGTKKKGTKKKSIGGFIKNDGEVSGLDKAKTADYQSKADLNQMKMRKVEREIEDIGQAKELNDLEKANLEKKQLDIMTNKLNVARSYLGNVNKVTFSSYRGDMINKGILQEHQIPTDEEYQAFSTVEENQWKSNFKNEKISNRDITAAKNADLAREKYQSNKDHKQDALYAGTIKRLTAKSDGDIAFLSESDQQKYYDAEANLDQSSMTLGRKIYLTPAIQEQIRSQYGNEDLTTKQMQTLLNKTNVKNKRIDGYALKNSANPDIISQYMERDGMTEIQIRRALANNGIKFEKNKDNFIKENIKIGIQSGLSIPQARQRAFSSYLEKLNQSRGM